MAFVRLISWNIAHRREPWRRLMQTGADIALLQEAGKPPAKVADCLEFSADPWGSRNRPWRAAVVKLSDGVRVEWMKAKRPRALAASLVTPAGGDPLIVASMYAEWERPHAATGSRRIFADASAHRIISDLSAFIGAEHGHRLIAAGDLNILHGYGEHGSPYWAGRYGSVFDRMESLGLAFVGPQAPNGRQAEPWPKELPADSKNVPTYHTIRKTPATATRQLDFVFASKELAPAVQVRALNEPDQWGPSDHCMIEIEISP